MFQALCRAINVLNVSIRGTDEEDGYESHAHMYGQHAQSMVSHAHINNSYSYLSVCNVWFTVRAPPRATPPSAPI